MDINGCCWVAPQVKRPFGGQKRFGQKVIQSHVYHRCGCAQFFRGYFPTWGALRTPPPNNCHMTLRKKGRETWWTTKSQGLGNHSTQINGTAGDIGYHISSSVQKSRQSESISIKNMPPLSNHTSTPIAKRLFLIAAGSERLKRRAAIDEGCTFFFFPFFWSSSHLRSSTLSISHAFEKNRHTCIMALGIQTKHIVQWLDRFLSCNDWVGFSAATVG